MSALVCSQAKDILGGHMEFISKFLGILLVKRDEEFAMLSLGINYLKMQFYHHWPMGCAVHSVGPAL